MKHLAILLAGFLLAAPVSLAAPPAADERPALVVPNDLRNLATEAGDRFAPPETPHLDLPSITVPLVQDGRLAGYAYLNVRLHLAADDDIPAIREQLHFLMHDLVTEAHAHPFMLISRDEFAGDETYRRWDNVLNARLGEGVVTSLEPLAFGLRLQRRRR